ncbi:hypothetical protein [Tepidibacter sp. Z1-5]|uniref:hypothetical protein n=1 Tax=Tepidibacter sp. Z1-5 TaxID=3134138 RepID=UPI0030C23F8D
MDTYLNYIPYGENEKFNETKLVYNYKSKNNAYALDAKTSKMISGKYNNEKTKDISDFKKQDIFKNAKSTVKLKKELTKEEATKLIKKNIKEKYNIDAELNNSEIKPY